MTENEVDKNGEIGNLVKFANVFAMHKSLLERPTLHYLLQLQIRYSMSLPMNQPAFVVGVNLTCRFHILC